MKLNKEVKISIIVGVFLFALLSFWFPFDASAQLGPGTPPGGLRDLSGGRGVVGFIDWILTRVLLPIAGLIAVLFLIIGGFQYILSGANEELAEKAKVTIRNSVIGLVVIILSYTIVRVVFNALSQ